MIGSHKCQDLIGLYNFCGVDWVGKFIGTGKKLGNCLLELDEDDLAISCFREHGEGSVTTELVSNGMPQQMKRLEQFVCKVYSSRDLKV